MMRGCTSLQSVDDLNILSERDCPRAIRLYRGLPREYCRNLVPGIYRDLCEESHQHNRCLEKQLFDKLKEKAKDQVKPPPLTDLQWLAVAQHHGMLTRLLDWTASAEVAVWFALNPASGEVENPCIWTFVVDPQDIADPQERGYQASPASIKKAAIAAGQRSTATDMFSGRGHAGRTLVFRHLTCCSRIRNQKGWFMCFPDRKQGQEGLPTAFEDNSRYTGELACWPVDETKRDSILSALAKRGIDKEHLFPPHEQTCNQGLESLCRELNGKWQAKPRES